MPTIGAIPSTRTFILHAALSALHNIYVIREALLEKDKIISLLLTFISKLSRKNHQSLLIKFNFLDFVGPPKEYLVHFNKLHDTPALNFIHPNFSGRNFRILSRFHNNLEIRIARNILNFQLTHTKFHSNQSSCFSVKE